MQLKKEKEYYSINQCNLIESNRVECITNKLAIIKIIESVYKIAETVKSKIGVLYYNIPISFDIETSSFYDTSTSSVQDKGEKVGIMYIWMINIHGYNIYGRHWDEFDEFMQYLINRFHVSLRQRIVIYVHNLGYEHGFIGSHFKWHEVHAMKKHKPFKAITEDGIEFRCSLFLSGYKLEKVGENLQWHESRKKTGQLDYDKIRHSETVLTDEEMDYCISDVEVMNDYITEMIVEYGDITKIPNTKTGRVRRLFRNNIFNGDKQEIEYRKLMSQLSFNDEVEYRNVKNAFMGGFTHCNPLYSNMTYNDICMKIDFTSSYPYVMVAENGFPMGKRQLTENPTEYEFEYALKNCACIFTAIFIGIECNFINDTYISYSKCSNVKTNVSLNNGRVVDADLLVITITNIDFEIIRIGYKWDKLKVCNLYTYKKDYLPTPFINTLLQLYSDKTTLKGVEGKDAEYLNGKENLNASYGMAVTNIIRNEITFNRDWLTHKLTEDEIKNKIDEYNKDKDRFLFYPWGVFVTAFARRNLWTNIFQFGSDYIYSDTDSIVCAKPQKHIEVVRKYNSNVIKKLRKASLYHNIPMEMFSPKTIEGIEKPLGMWEIEDICLRFKSLGAKRYLQEIPDTKVKKRKTDYKRAMETLLTDNPDWIFFEQYRQSGKHTKLKFTVAGVEKAGGVKYLDRDGHDKAFEYFNENCVIPSEYSGKSILTYITERRQGSVTDYLGVTSEYKEESCVHFERGDYSFSLDDAYLEWILGLQQL